MNAALEELCATGAALRDAVQRVIIGQEQVVEEALIALLCGGHVLIEGVPGLGKTLLVESLAKAINGQFHRVQFTPDLLPADITGSMIYDPGESRFKFRRGPVFTNLLLADEINRAPAKTQAALLEVMQERQVTIEGKTLPLAAPFMVLATQNPFEQEGTYHLPEAQLDRFLLNSRIDYPQEAQEKALLSRLLGFEVPLANNTAAITPLLDATTLPTLQKTLLEVQVDERIIDYALALVRKTRAMPQFSAGAGPRARASPCWSPHAPAPYYKNAATLSPKTSRRLRLPSCAIVCNARQKPKLTTSAPTPCWRSSCKPCLCRGNDHPGQKPMARLGSTRPYPSPACLA